MTTEHEERITELECRITLLDEYIQTLEKQCFDQAKQLEKIHVILEQQRTLIDSLSASPTGHAGDEPPPPHY